MSSTKLKKAPLKEVIFELRWEPAVDITGVQIDNGFDLAQGKFASRQEQEFPVYKKLLPDNIPFKIYGSPINQFWKGELEWPVVQHGQGVLAINDVEASYEWEEKFFPLIKATVGNLIASYSTPLKFNRIKLHYIDACDIVEGDGIEFMKTNLQTEILTRYEIPGNQRNFNIQQGYELEEGSVLTLSISNGLNNQNNQKSVIWNTVVEKAGKIEKFEIIPWLESAHSHTSSMFKKMLNPDFYANLDS
ncbi:TIGR04255 family protein [Algoriphagus sp. C2-6-M1]|uniref:TIGR04255 family protein n=1 Tax=Algoriphagus persicinus TaxID=3108754 RepID=UPI002B3B1CDD|nr:TIGR04255 family protein [Algoriphagus sp. C2-6-M1]MEB2782682.1 TIGR04255 family protein [Algoriphagus sp. C2-6-M1]